MVATDSWAFILDGEAQARRFPIGIDRIVFSPDGARVAYVVKYTGWDQLVVDGELLPSWEGVRGITFNPAGDRLAYGAFTDRRTPKGCVVVDGVPGPLGTIPLRAVFNPDGKRLAYRLSHVGHPWLVLDGKVQSWGGGGDPHSSQDSRHVAVIERAEGKHQVNVDGPPGPDNDLTPEVLRGGIW